jgi:hypothetical protein
MSAISDVSANVTVVLRFQSCVYSRSIGWSKEMMFL